MPMLSPQEASGSPGCQGLAGTCQSGDVAAVLGEPPVAGPWQTLLFLLSESCTNNDGTVPAPHIDPGLESGRRAAIKPRPLILCMENFLPALPSLSSPPQLLFQLQLFFPADFRCFVFCLDQ